MSFWYSSLNILEWNELNFFNFFFPAYYQSTSPNQWKKLVIHLSRSWWPFVNPSNLCKWHGQISVSSGAAVGGNSLTQEQITLNNHSSSPFQLKSLKQHLNVKRQHLHTHSNSCGPPLSALFSPELSGTRLMIYQYIWFSLCLLYNN